MNIIGDRLKEIRETLDIKQKDVASILKISNKTLSNYENNVSSPDPDTIKSLCEFYKISSDYLLDISINKSSNNPSLYLESNPSKLPYTNENENNYKNDSNYSSLSDDELKVFKYYNRLNEENKDSIKGIMVNLFRDQESSNYQDSDSPYN